MGKLSFVYELWVGKIQLLTVVTIVIYVKLVSMALDLHRDVVWFQISLWLHHAVTGAQQLV